MGALTDWLDRTEAEHTTDHPYCTGCPLTQSTAALRAVLALADDWDAALPGVADDLRHAIATALGVTP